MERCEGHQNEGNTRKKGARRSKVHRRIGAFSGPPLCAGREGGRAPTHPEGSGWPSSPAWPMGEQEQVGRLRGQENPSLFEAREGRGKVQGVGGI